MDSKWAMIDTRLQGAMSQFLDGLFHIVPRSEERHQLDLTCWCEPRVNWSPEAGTCIVSHRWKHHG